MTLKISLKAFDIVYLIKAWPYKFLYRKKNFGLLEIEFKMFLVIRINFNSWIFNSKCLHNSREISASGCWVKHWQFQFLVGANDEYLQFKFSLQFICVWGIFFNSYNLIIIFTNISIMLLPCTTRDFNFDFLGQVLETKMLRRLQSKSKIIRYFYRKFLGFSEKLLLQLHAIQLQDFVSNRVIRHFNTGKIKFKNLYIKNWTAYTVYYL